jgi:YHS domain-containing protein
MNPGRHLLVSTLMLCIAFVLLIPPVELRLPPRPPSVQDLLVKGPLCFKWSEVMGDRSIEHDGGVVFLLKDHRIFSRAWYTRAKYAREWPPVFGVGTGDGNLLHVAYRSASMDPKHEFYHTVCHFEFSPDAQTFLSHYMQQATSGSPELTPGAARGTRCEISDDFAEQMERLKLRMVYASRNDFADEGFEHCPVITENRAQPQNEVLYEGKLYHFCCTSCRDVFLKNPRVFISKK